MIKNSLALAAVLLVGALNAHAQENRTPLVLESAWSRELPPVSENGAAYVSVRNPGSVAVHLLRVATPAATRAEVHESITRDGMTAMRPVPSVVIAPGGVLHMGPGGLHIMLMKLVRPLRRGEQFTVTLYFADAPPLPALVTVQGMGARSADPGIRHDHGAEPGMKHGPGKPPG